MEGLNQSERVFSNGYFTKNIVKKEVFLLEMTSASVHVNVVD